MLCETDDAGRLVADASQLRALIWAYHPRVQVSHVEAAMLTLETVGLIRLYCHNGIRYAEFPSFSDHQRLDRPTPSKLPMYDTSSSPRRALVEDSWKTLEGSNRIEQNRTEQKGIVEPSSNEAAKEVLAFLNTKARRQFRFVATTLDPINARLKAGATVQNCKGVIARKVREWGNDPRMAKYLRPETLFNATKFESYLGEREREPDA